MLTKKTITDFPALYSVRQKLAKASVGDVGVYLYGRLRKSGLHDCINRGTTVGIAVGSRGINGISTMTRVLVDLVKERGGKALIIPAMGSHGGACADGQRDVLAAYGVTRDNVGAEIASSMDVVDLGPTGNGLHVYFDKIAAGCDMVVAVNRIKEHTDFYGETESGIVKMLAVGLGNDIGASYIHSMGSVGLSKHIPAIAAGIIKQKRIFGIGIVEDGYGDTARIDVFCDSDIIEKEKELLMYAKSMKAKIPFKKINYLIIGEIGKNISGSGIDTKVAGRIRYPGVREPASPAPDVIVGLRLTPESHGNAAGVGLLDLISRRLYDSIDIDVTFENAKSSKSPERYKIPMFMKDDYNTIELGMKFSKVWQSFGNKVLLIKNTGELEMMYATGELIYEGVEAGKLEMLSEKPVSLYFTQNNEYISPFTTNEINLGDAKQ